MGLCDRCADIQGQTGEFRQRTQADCLTNVFHAREITVSKRRVSFYETILSAPKLFR